MEIEAMQAVFMDDFESRSESRVRRSSSRAVIQEDPGEFKIKLVPDLYGENHGMVRMDGAVRSLYHVLCVDE